MALMSRLPLVAVAGAACAALALPAYASAEIIEIGKVDPPPMPSCPTRPCLAVSRTTGYQAKIGPTRGVMTIPKDGSIVAWTIALGKPGAKQTDLLQRQAGRRVAGPDHDPQPAPQAALARRRPGRPAEARAVLRHHRAVPAGQVDPGQEGLGRRAHGARRGRPRWPSGLGADTSWRASRAKGTCEDTSTNTVQTQPNQLAQYYCLYKTARLAYSATLVTAPDARGAAPRPSQPATARAARSASRRPRARSAGGRAGGRRGPARARRAPGARGSRPNAGGGGSRRPRSAARRRRAARSSSSREEMTSLCGEAHAPSRAARGRAGEVGVALGLGQALDGPLDAHRAVDLQPAEGQRGVGVGGEGARLGGAIVGVEAVAALVEPAQQHVARGRASVGADRRHGHRLGLVDPGLARGGQPDAELLDRVGADVGAGEMEPVVVEALAPERPLTGARVVLAELAELARARRRPCRRCPCRPWTCRRTACRRFPVDVPPVPVCAGCWGCAWRVAVPPAEDWPWVCVWSVEVVPVWSVEVVPVSLCVLDVPVEVWASASAPGRRRQLGHVAGTTSWVASSLPQALRPRHATARRRPRTYACEERVEAF